MQIDNVNIEGLYKYYNKFVALEDINLSMKKGEIFGIIGSNGNGKSTLLNCITGVLNYEKGHIYIDGTDLKKKPLLCKQKMAYCTDECNAYEIMTGEEYLTFVASIYKVDNETFSKKYNELLDMFNMRAHIKKLIKYYSHGTKQKIVLMAAMIHDPLIWILDEPLVGLDAYSIKVLLEYFKTFKANGGTIIITIHDIDVALKVCDRVAIIKEGHLAAQFNNTKDKTVKSKAMKIMQSDALKEIGNED